MAYSPDLPTVTERLVHLVGKGLEKAQLVDLGCLTGLPVVLDQVPFGMEISIAQWREGVRATIEEAVANLGGGEGSTYAVLNGRINRIDVSAERVREAITTSFNLELRSGLGTAEVRREKAKRSLGLSCSSRAYYEYPGPEWDLMRFLADELIRLGNDRSEVRTEKLAITIFQDLVAYDIGTRRIEAFRMLRAKVPGARHLENPFEFGLLPYTNWKPLGGTCQVRKLGTVYTRHWVVDFPAMRLGDTREIGYREHRTLPCLCPLFELSPPEPVGLITIRLKFPAGFNPGRIFAFEGSLSSPSRPLGEGRGLIPVAPDSNGEYCYTFANPTPFLYYGLFREFRAHKGREYVPDEEAVLSELEWRQREGHG